MIVISSALAASPAYTASSRRPVIGWDNMVAATNVEATSEDADYPASNLANPNTVLLWKSEVITDQYLTVTLDTVEAIDYLAVARHNFGTGEVICSVEGLSADEGATWTELVADQTLSDDSPVLFRFTPTNLASIRLKLQPNATAPQAAVLYVGALLVMEKGLQPGNTPLNHGRRRTIVNSRSESGEFLGKVQTGEGLTSVAEFRVLTSTWYRTNLDPFLDEAPPFFFAWSPYTYPSEVAFAWLTEDTVPVVSHAAGFISVTLQMDGLAL